MKTQDLLVSYERKENVAKIFSFVSLIGIIVGIIFGLLYLIYENSPYDTIAIYGLTIFMLPFVLLQFFMTAGIYGNGLGKIYFLFYLLLFPFVNMWFFSGINAIFHIIPTYYYSHNRGTGITMAEIEELRRQAWLCVGGIYLLMNGLGLLWRILKKVIRKNQLVLLSL